MKISYDHDEIWLDFDDLEFDHYPSGKIDMWAWDLEKKNGHKSKFENEKAHLELTGGLFVMGLFP
jgi:hypothetical protein